MAVPSVEEKHTSIFHVLAVDDSNIDRKLLERLLTVSEFRVTCVESGDKALEYLGLLEYQTDQHQVSKVNLIMTDYSMPGITGYDLLKKIKDSSWKDVPVIVMSSENVPSRINMCLEGGAEEFLLKPVKLSDLSKLQSHILKYSITRQLDDCRETTTTTTTTSTMSVDGDEIVDSVVCNEEEKIITVTTNEVHANRDDSEKEKITATTNNEVHTNRGDSEKEKITVTTNNEIDIINRDDGEKEKITITANNEIHMNRDKDESENDMNCSNATRKATLTTILMSSDLSDRRPHVQELPVA